MFGVESTLVLVGTAVGHNSGLCGPRLRRSKPAPRQGAGPVAGWTSYNRSSAAVLLGRSMMWMDRNGPGE